MRTSLLCSLVLVAIGQLCAGCGAAKDPPDCSGYTEECPDYAGEGTYCQDQNLFRCEVACDPDCGCFGSAKFIETCVQGCEDEQDGYAKCTKE